LLLSPISKFLLLFAQSRPLPLPVCVLLLPTRLPRELLRHLSLCGPLQLPLLALVVSLLRPAFARLLVLDAQDRPFPDLVSVLQLPRSVVFPRLLQARPLCEPHQLQFPTSQFLLLCEPPQLSPTPVSALPQPTQPLSENQPLLLSPISKFLLLFAQSRPFRLPVCVSPLQARLLRELLRHLSLLLLAALFRQPQLPGLPFVLLRPAFAQPRRVQLLSWKGWLAFLPLLPDARALLVHAGMPIELLQAAQPLTPTVSVLHCHLSLSRRDRYWTIQMIQYLVLSTISAFLVATAQGR